MLSHFSKFKGFAFRVTGISSQERYFESSSSVAIESEGHGAYALEIIEDQTAEDVRDWCKVINRYGRRTVLLGDGADDFREILIKELTVPYRFAPIHQNRQRAGALAVAAMQYYEQGKMQDVALVRPVYLRKSQAEREREQRLNEESKTHGE